jgi:hypothetical protein
VGPKVLAGAASNSTVVLVGPPILQQASANTTYVVLGPPILNGSGETSPLLRGEESSFPLGSGITTITSTDTTTISKNSKIITTTITNTTTVSPDLNASKIGINE